MNEEAWSNLRLPKTLFSSIGASKPVSQWMRLAASVVWQNVWTLGDLEKRCFHFLKKIKSQQLTLATPSVNIFKQSSAALRDDIHEPGFCFWKFVVRGAPFKKRCFQIVVQETVSSTWSHTIQNYAILSSNACLLGDLENGNLVVQENQYLFHILHQLKVVV